MKVIQRAYLGVSSATLEPAAITSRLGLEPDEVIPKGSRPRGPGAIPLPVAHLWSLDSGAPASSRLDDQVCALLARVEGQAAAIRALAASGDASVYVSVVRTFVAEPEPETMDFDAAEPQDSALARIGFHLDPATLAHLAELGIGLDVDEYG